MPMTSNASPIAACLVGRDDESNRAWEQAHLEFVRLGDPDRAAQCVFWLGMGLLLREDIAQASGWLARASRLVDEAGTECAASGYLLIPKFLEALGGGDAVAAQSLAADIIGIGRRFENREVLAFGMLCSGEAALALRETRRGMQELDEAMVAVATGDVSPIAAGILYCAVIAACMEGFDLRRAAEWTEAHDQWCGAQPDLVPYRGQCLVHRSQVQQAHGAWAEAVADAEQARMRLSDPAHPALGQAYYQQGELHRLRGEFTQAERAYRAANQHGREPAPGMALLRLAEGNLDAAVASIRRMVDESHGQLRLPIMLSASVEVMLDAGDVADARRAADELAQIAATTEMPLLLATADLASSSVLLAEGDAREALAHARRACAGWRGLEMPYETARAQVQIGLACRALGDHDAADFELAGARDTFEQLGARPDVTRVEGLSARVDRESSKLTDRECEVIRLVAAGKTNREIAVALVISEHTVGRHLQNIFMRLGLSSRSAATAYAYEHNLV